MNNVQLNTRIKTILSVNCPSIVSTLLIGYLTIISSLLAINLISEIPIDRLTKDPLALANQPFYLGAFSHLGILFWCSAAAICFFSFALLKKAASKRETKTFFLASGLVTSFLLIDDLFLLHEEVFPKYFGIPEKLVFLTYAIVIAVYLVRFGKKICKTQYIPLLLAFGLFGFSVLCDTGKLPLPAYLLENEPQILLEDSSKLMGIFSWLIYFAKESTAQIRSAKFQSNEINEKCSENRQRLVC